MERYDIAIIGSGPAGLEAAITAKLRNKNILLIGTKNLSIKVTNAHTVSNYLGLPDVSGEDMQHAFLSHLDKMNLDITEDKVNTVYSMGSYFMIQGQGNMYESSSVVLACGMSVSRPLPGETQNLGRGVSYCATCDAMLYKGKTSIVIGYSKDEEKEAEFLAEVAEKVYYIPMYEESVSLGENIEIINGAKPVSIEKKEQKIQLNLENDRLIVDGIFILRENIAPAQLVPGVTIENNAVSVDKNMKTNIAGLFACGDITGAPYQYIKAAGEGNVAALSAVKYLADL